MRFSIDGHPLTIVEADGVAVEPRTVDRVLVDVAQVCKFSSVLFITV
jgi:FtsP/CotA-like multicopper oxidase with cupredoxin domain